MRSGLGEVLNCVGENSLILFIPWGRNKIDILSCALEFYILRDVGAREFHWAKGHYFKAGYIA